MESDRERELKKSDRETESKKREIMRMRSVRLRARAGIGRQWETKVRGN